MEDFAFRITEMTAIVVISATSAIPVHKNAVSIFESVYDIASYFYFIFLVYLCVRVCECSLTAHAFSARSNCPFNVSLCVCTTGHAYEAIFASSKLGLPGCSHTHDFGLSPTSTHTTAEAPAEAPSACTQTVVTPTPVLSLARLVRESRRYI